jgi:uncharacterized protein (DUF58 family)
MQRQRLRFRRIRVRITASGWMYIVMTILVGAAAVNTTNNLLYLVTSTLLALMAASGWVALRALRNLELELYLPREVFAGEATQVHFAVLNRRRHLPTYLLRLQRGEHSAEVIEVPPSGSADGTLAFAFTQRGVHELGDVLVTSTFPFGLFVRGGYMRMDGRVLVYPAPVLPPDPPPDGAVQNHTGQSAARVGAGGDYRGTRPYLPGDAPGRIDWKIWSRGMGLYVKEFYDQGGPPLVLTLESVPGPGLEERMSQLTGLTVEAHRQGRPVGLRLPGKRPVEPALGASHRARLLRALALYPGGG